MRSASYTEQTDEIYMCTEFHINTWKYVWATHQVFWWCSRGRRRASVPRLGPSLSGVLNVAGFQCVCTFSRVFDHVKPPQKCPDSQKKLKKSPKENNRISDFLLGGAHDMRCKSCSARWDLYVYRVSYEYVQVCVSYTSSFLMCSRGRRRASVPRPGPSLSGVLTATGSNVCANFQEFLTMLSPQKCPDSLKITKKEYWGLTRCHGNSILDINIPFRVSHRPCFYSILMKFEANWVKVR